MGLIGAGATNDGKYIGAAPNFGQSSVFRFVATNGQTSFSGLDARGNTLAFSLVEGAVAVYVNGLSLTPTQDFTTPSASQIVLSRGLSANDEIYIVAQSSWSAIDSLKSTIQTLSAAQKLQVLSNLGIAFSAANILTLNATLSFAVGSNALTCSLLTAAAVVPSVSDQIAVPFRSASYSSGGLAVRQISSALTLTIPSGATIGHANGVIASLYWYLIDNAGTVELAVAGSFLGNDGIISTTALSGASSSSSTMYSANVRSNVAFQLIGRSADTQTTAGTWAATPSHVQVVSRLSEIEQTVEGESTSNALLSASIPFDDTPPQSSEGTQIISLPFMPRWPGNHVRVLSRGYGGQNGSFGLVAAIFCSLSANALDANWFVTNGSGFRSSFSCQAEHAPGTISQITYSLRVGPAGAGAPAVLNGTYNGTTISRDFGGIARTTLVLEEITK